MNITIKQLQIFKCVAECLNFHRAAEKLFISQPAVTKQIQNLESEIGFKVFDKLGKRTVLTAKGKTLQYEINGLINQFNLLKKNIAKDIFKQRSFSLAVIPTLEELIVDAMIILVKKHPEIKVNMTVMSNKEMQKIIQTNKFDICIGANIKSIRDYVSQIFFSTPIYLVANYDHYLKDKKNIDRDYLQHEIFIEINSSSFFQQQMRDFKERYDMAKNSRINILGRSAVIKAVSAGLGVSLLPWFAIKDKIRNKELCILDIDKNKYIADYSFIYHKDKELDFEVIDFLEILKKSVLKF